MGPRAAMACTAAVETEIERHYNEKLDAIGDHDPELTAHISDFRDEEVEHRRTAIAHRAEQAPAYQLLSAVVRLGCRPATANSRSIRTVQCYCVATFLSTHNGQLQNGSRHTMAKRM